MLELKTIDIRKSKVNTLAVPVCEDEAIHTNQSLTELVQQATGLEEFSGKAGEEVVLYDPPGVKVHRLIFRGLGPCAKVDAESLRAFAGEVVKKCIRQGLDPLILAPPDAARLDLAETSLLSALLEGACLGNQVLDAFKKEKKERPLSKISLLVARNQARRHAGLTSRIETVCRAALTAREWVNTPSNEKPPQMLAKAMIKATAKTGLKTSLLSEPQLRQKKFGALLAVAAGSSNRPVMLVMEYTPPKADKTVVLVGKGVTFDTGGINLKPSSSMEGMKGDMAGAAAVAGALLALSQLKPAFKIVGVIPLVENMPSGTATRPSDIIRSLAGKSIEIGNTDAEGRLILADAITWAIKRYKPATLIDLATLTGACLVALGEHIAGVFSADDTLAEAILAAGRATHERCWRLPLIDDYKEHLKSDLADLSNVGGTRWGGAITAALFLAEFAGDTRWAHIDIAGPAFSKKAGPYCEPGGTGFGVRLLCDLMARL